MSVISALFLETFAGDAEPQPPRAVASPEGELF